MRQPIHCVRLGFVLLAGLAACADGSGPEPRGSTLSSPSPDTEAHGLDSVYLAIEAQVPGFAGFYVQPDSVYVLRLTDPSDSVDAEQVVTGYLRSQTGQAPNPRFVILTARYSFGQLFAWKRVMTSLMSDREASGLDADEVLNAVHLVVVPGSNLDAWRARVEALGVPTDAIVVSFGELPTARPGT